jgi:hypothetical protein
MGGGARLTGVSILPLLVSLAGCTSGTSDTLYYQVGRLGGHPTLALLNQLVVFEAVEDPGPDDPRRGSGSVWVRGIGGARGQASVNGLTLSHSYEHGVQTISIGGSSVKIVEDGSRLQFSNLAVRLYDRAKTLRLAADGSARSEEP